MNAHKSCPILALAALPALALLANASSHREAPFVTETPKVDATDFYMFTSYEDGRSDYVTLVANYLPLQDAYGGPNYFKLDSRARYDIHIDNDGDAVEDITFRFNFVTRSQDLTIFVGNPGQQKAVAVPLRNIGPLSPSNLGAVNDREGYKLTVVEGPVAAPTSATPVSQVGTGSTAFEKPLDNIGEKSIVDYEAYADAHMYDIQLPGGLTGRMFVGQRRDPFVVNLGETFDLVNLNPLGAPDAKRELVEGQERHGARARDPQSLLA